jgi:steroid 5-alpha reductase family enzyme
VSGFIDVFVATAVAIGILMLATWLLSLVLRDASIVDIVWGAGYVLTAWVAFVVADGTEARRWLLAGMTTLWGGRLAIYLFWRNAGKGEDPRYQAMRRHWGDRFWIVSLVTVFLLQGTLMWTVSLPVQMGQVPDSPDSLGVVDLLGVAVFALGFVFEAVGDYQLARFKADPGNRGQVLDTGLWRYTRHPNYFGDFCVWWGLFLVAAATGVGVWSIIGPIAMTVFLLRVSGVTMLERTITKRRPGYEDYIATTNAFFPGPRKPLDS